MLSFIKNLLPAIKGGLSLSKIWKSKTTMTEYVGVFPTILAAALVFIGNQFPNTLFAETDTQIILLTLIMSTLSPILTRILAFTNRPKLLLGENATSYVLRVRNKGDESWTSFKFTLLDAFEEGWYEALIPKREDKGKARIYNLKTHKFSKEEIRISDREVEEALAWGP